MSKREYMVAYSVEKLMTQTRRLAKDYHETTGQSLPVTAELARFDAVRLLGLTPVTGESLVGVDAISDRWQKGESILIKGRVIFTNEIRKERLGQLNYNGTWQRVLLVLFNSAYEVTAIYAVSRNDIDSWLSESKSKRATMTVARFAKMGELAWHDK